MKVIIVSRYLSFRPGSVERIRFIYGKINFLSRPVKCHSKPFISFTVEAITMNFSIPKLVPLRCSSGSRLRDGAKLIC